MGRVREMILCGGFNVYPTVVDATLNRLPGIADSAVAGAPDPRLGEVPVAVLVAKGEPPAADEVRAALRAELAPYEIPRRLVFDSALPRTDNGKIDRPGVVRRVAAEVGADTRPGRSAATLRRAPAGSGRRGAGDAISSRRRESG